jgi:serine/threonine-protein kinase
VPPNVAAALAKALEKLPADRFDSAKAFAEALTNPAFTAVTPTGAAAPPGPRTHAPATTTILAALVVILVAALAWSLGTRGRGAAHPTVYDVGLPDSAPLAVPGEQPFAVGPRGDFVVYVADEGGRNALWYRSLRDSTSRRIQGTEWASRPAISPDGARLAFLRAPEDPFRWTLEIVSIEGGSSTTLGVGNTEANLQWLDDGRLQVVEGDGSHVRWFDPGGGPTEERPTRYCILPTYLTDRDQFLCGGGGETYASLVPVHDTTKPREDFWTGAADSTFVFGTDFRLVDGRYLVYLSLGGDLLAAPVDLSTRRVGRSVRLVTGIQRTAYWGAGSYGLSRSGALVYVQGPNYALGSLVATDGRTFDTLNVGRAQFHLFAMSPDGRRLAAVVDDLEGAELRVYTLATGEHVLLARSPFLRQPVWSPGGDRILFTVDDTLYLGAPDASMAPRRLGVAPDDFEAFSWSLEHQVVGGAWDAFQALTLDPTTEQLQWDTVATDAAFPSASPDGRWIAYNDRALTTVWISPVPPNRRRHQIGPGWEPHWRSNRELVFGQVGGAVTVSLDFSQASPVAVRSPAVRFPDFTDTAGQSYQLTADGRYLYVRTVPVVPKRYLRVVPDWVDQMKRAVEEANP